MDGLEKKLDELLVKKAPFQIPENGRKMIAEWLPWITGALVVFYAWTVWAFYQLFRFADSFVRYANEISRAYGGTQVSEGIGMFGWLWIGVSVAQIALMGLAIPGLMKKQRAGWNFLFYSELLAVAVTILSLARGRDVFSGFLSGAVGVVLGMYVLFQIRSQYTGKVTAKK